MSLLLTSVLPCRAVYMSQSSQLASFCDIFQHKILSVLSDCKYSVAAIPFHDFSMLFLVIQRDRVCVTFFFFFYHYIYLYLTATLWYQFCHSKSYLVMPVIWTVEQCHSEESLENVKTCTDPFLWPHSHAFVYYFMTCNLCEFALPLLQLKTSNLMPS